MRIALLVLGFLLWLAGTWVTVIEWGLSDATALDATPMILALVLVVSGALLSVPAAGPKPVGAVMLVTGLALVVKPFALPFQSTHSDGSVQRLSLDGEANLYFFGGAVAFLALGAVLLLRRKRPVER
jgi:hypothetical protein